MIAYANWQLGCSPLVSNLSRTEILELLGLSVALFPFSFFSRSSLIFFARVIISYYRKEVAFRTHLHLKISTSPTFPTSNSPSWKIRSSDVLTSGLFIVRNRYVMYGYIYCAKMHDVPTVVPDFHFAPAESQWRCRSIHPSTVIYLPGFRYVLPLEYGENGFIRISRCWNYLR